MTEIPSLFRCLVTRSANDVNPSLQGIFSVVHQNELYLRPVSVIRSSIEKRACLSKSPIKRVAKILKADKIQNADSLNKLSINTFVKFTGG